MHAITIAKIVISCLKFDRTAISVESKPALSPAASANHLCLHTLIRDADANAVRRPNFRADASVRGLPVP